MKKLLAAALLAILVSVGVGQSPVGADYVDCRPFFRSTSGADHEARLNMARYSGSLWKLNYVMFGEDAAWNNFPSLVPAPQYRWRVTMGSLNITTTALNVNWAQHETWINANMGPNNPVAARGSIFNVYEDRWFPTPAPGRWAVVNAWQCDTKFLPV